MSNEEGHYGLVMPFVVTTPDGPYDSAAFVAGARFGQLMERLEQTKPAEHVSWEYPAMLPQLDLLAMHLGYTLTQQPWEGHEDEWTLVKFTHSPDPAADPTEEA